MTGNPERVVPSFNQVIVSNYRFTLFYHIVTLGLMAQSLAKILVHIVFSTKERRPFLREEGFRSELHQYLGGILLHLGCQPIIVGGVTDHVHVLASLARTCEPAEMVKELKRGSTLWIKRKNVGLQDFCWQNGYAIFSIGFSQINSLERYISDQVKHHQIRSFQDEFRTMLQRYKIEYDERYVWD